MGPKTNKKKIPLGLWGRAMLPNVTSILKRIKNDPKSNLQIFGTIPPPPGMSGEEDADGGCVHPWVGCGVRKTNK